VALAVPALAVVAVGVGLAVDSAGAAPQQTIACAWERVATNSRPAIHFATAYDNERQAMYVYGGVDGSFQPINTLQAADLSGTTPRTSWGNVAAASALRVVGAAGAYRPGGAVPAAGALYFFGGMTDTGTGNAVNDVQRYVPESRAWQRNFVDNRLDFRARVFPAAAYDPLHDVIWVVGGTTRCSLTDVLAGQPCNATSLPTQYLGWDPASGAAVTHTLPGGDQQVFGASLVFDAPRQRLLLFGGTRNIQRSEGTVRALDLSDPDPAKAAWSTLETQGQGPAVYFHGGAFLADRDWMVVYGGTRQNFLQQNEANEQTTYGLDLSTTPATWVDLKPAGSPGARVAGGMEYAATHRVALLVLGRDRYVPADPPSARVQVTTFALTCTAAGPTPPPATATSTATGTSTATAEATATFTATATTQPVTPTETEPVEPTEPLPPTDTPEPTATEELETPTATDEPEPGAAIFLPYARRGQA